MVYEAFQFREETRRRDEKRVSMLLRRIYLDQRQRDDRRGSTTTGSHKGTEGTVSSPTSADLGPSYAQQDWEELVDRSKSSSVLLCSGASMLQKRKEEKKDSCPPPCPVCGGDSGSFLCPIIPVPVLFVLGRSSFSCPHCACGRAFLTACGWNLCAWA